MRQNHSLHFCHIDLEHFMQTLKVLHLFHNPIGNEGAQYLEQLEKNKENLELGCILNNNGSKYFLLALWKKSVD